MRSIFKMLSLAWGLFSTVQAQNLVQNGSFEGRPTALTDCEKPFQAPSAVQNWMQSGGTPQIYSYGTSINCSGNGVGGFGDVYPHSGSTYGFLGGNQANSPYNLSGLAYSEGMFQTLNLMAGKVYTLSFWVRSNNDYYPSETIIYNSDYYIEAVNGLQQTLITDGNSVSNGNSLPNINASQRQVLYHGTSLDNNNWHQISTKFYCNQNFTQLWIYSGIINDPNFSGSLYVCIDDIEIVEDITPIDQLYSSDATNGFLCGTTQFSMPLGSTFYNWFSPTNNISISGSGSVITVQPLSSGKATLCVQVDNGFTYCNFLQSGPSFVDSLSVDNMLNPGPVSVNSGSTHYVHVIPPFRNIPSYAFSTIAGNGNMYLNLSGINGGNAQVNVSGSIGSSYLRITTSNPCGNYTRDVTFYIPTYYRVAPNPAKENLDVIFDDTSVPEALPDQIEIISEKEMQVIKSVNVQEAQKNRSFHDTNSIRFNVSDIARGIYYLRVTNSRQSDDKRVEVIRISFD